MDREPISFRELFYNHEAGQIEARVKEEGRERIVSRSAGEYAEEFINQVLEIYFGFPEERI